MIIGLTGGIATGKSNVSQYLGQRGDWIVDADTITHSVQAKGQPGLRAIIQTFGSQYLKSNGNLNRAKLGHFVFTHPQKLRQLVRIIDPFISKHVVLDAPTLFESGYQYLVDKVMVVSCGPVIQLHRLMQRDHLSITDAESRIDSQWPLSIKERLADWVINSDGTKRQTLSQVSELIDRHQI
ncbi:MAG: dephospho-CoA kinase [Acetilactobacillus jinshanensis]